MTTLYRIIAWLVGFTLAPIADAIYGRFILGKGLVR